MTPVILDPLRLLNPAPLPLKLPYVETMFVEAVNDPDTVAFLFVSSSNAFPPLFNGEKSTLLPDAIDPTVTPQFVPSFSDADASDDWLVANSATP